MSANNWQVCPQCERRRSAEQAALVVRAQEAYGRVSAAEYKRLVDAACNLPALEETLREDWEIGVSGAVFDVGYRCYCEACGFEFRFKHEEALPLGEEK